MKKLKICALMTTYNEVDVAAYAVKALIDQGIEVYVIDNGSTDGTPESLVGFKDKGLIDIEVKRFFENGQEIYNWMELLQTKEAVAKKLKHDWFLHVDADEVRHAPWADLTLSEGIERVDKEGFNLINFRVYNFQLTETQSSPSDSIESRLLHYNPAEPFDTIQVKAWKRSEHFDLATLGGHLVRVPEPSVYPVRFILKHFPLRSREQAKRKIFFERKARFSKVERARGWHVQYDRFISEQELDKYLDSCIGGNSTLYDHSQECADLQAQAAWVLTSSSEADEIKLVKQGTEAFIYHWISIAQTRSLETEPCLLELQKIISASNSAGLGGDLSLQPIIQINQNDVRLQRFKSDALISLARVNYLKGNPKLLDKLIASY